MPANEPLFEKIASQLTVLFAKEYQVGERLPPELALCEKMEVSLMTLRESLAILHHKGIIEKKRGSGNYYQPRRTDRHVALLVPWQKRRNHSISPGLVEGVELLINGLAEDKVPFRIYFGRQAEEDNVFVYSFPEILPAVAQGEVLLAVNFLGRLSNVTRQALNLNKVMLCGFSPNADIRVVHNNAQGIRNAVEWLAANGRKHIAFMDVLAKSEGHVTTSTERYSAFCEALYSARLPVVPEWVLREFHPAQSGAGWSNVREMWSSRIEKPDALLLSDETFLPDVAVAMHELNIKVPEQLYIVSQCTLGYEHETSIAAGYILTSPEKHALKVREVIQMVATGTSPEKTTHWIDTEFVPADFGAGQGDFVKHGHAQSLAQHVH